MAGLRHDKTCIQFTLYVLYVEYIASHLHCRSIVPSKVLVLRGGLLFSTNHVWWVVLKISTRQLKRTLSDVWVPVRDCWVPPASAIVTLGTPSTIPPTQSSRLSFSYSERNTRCVCLKNHFTTSLVSSPSAEDLHISHVSFDQRFAAAFAILPRTLVFPETVSTVAKQLVF